VATRYQHLPLLESAWVDLEYHPTRRPLDADEHRPMGCYTARLCAGPSAEGSTDREAVEALARMLRSMVGGEALGPGVTAVGQALNAARLMGGDALTDWLAERVTGPPLLMDPTDEDEYEIESSTKTSSSPREGADPASDAAERP
jgi:hypothetical protein